MKKIKFCLMFALLGIVASCSDNDTVIFDSSEGGIGLLGFQRSIYDFPVEIDTTGETLSLILEVSNLSNVDRVYTINVLESSTADPDNYSIPSTITIPANSYSGEIVIVGNDVTLETSAETLDLELVDVSEDQLSLIRSSITVNLFQVCPIPPDYLVGTYTLGNLSGVVGPGNGTTNFEETMVTVSIGESQNQRVFRSALLPGFRPGKVDVVINLICGEIILANTGPSTPLGCAAGTAIRYGSATNNSPYDLSSDDFFFINYNEDVDGSCGGPFVDQTFFLEK